MTHGARPVGIRAEAGASLIEILMALSILTMVLIALGGLMFQVARDTNRSAMASYRSVASANAAAWALALPWDSLATAVGCRNDSVGQLTYLCCTNATTVSARLKSLRIVITPQGWLANRPDTVLVMRSKPKLPSPLKVR